MKCFSSPGQKTLSRQRRRIKAFLPQAQSRRWAQEVRRL